MVLCRMLNRKPVHHVMEIMKMRILKSCTIYILMMMNSIVIMGRMVME